MEALSAEKVDGVDHDRSGLEGKLGQQVDKLLTTEGIASLAARCARLLMTGQFPAPRGQMSPHGQAR